ncbi:MAG TPA: hypothetical protein VN277_07910 [Acidiferrobacterales bacterium]|nr:hypothetical protein [Acidiferrobacterales bacterium]
MTDTASASSASALNRECLCTTINPAELERELAAALGDNDLYRAICATRPHLFSATAVFVTPQQVDTMRAVIEAVEMVIATPAYRTAALADASTAAAHDPHCPGVFLGYDFHLGEHGPRLIEINTNAGGALLNAYLARAQKACCPEMHGLTTGPVALAALEEEFVAMFRSEWRAARGNLPLSRIAIVDDAPATQYLHPEFILFQALFRHHGIDALIADPTELEIDNGRLVHTDGPVDLVYNRLTDFALDELAHATLRTAWRDDLALITPHPRAHALYADKRNLIPLTDPEWLRSAGIPPTLIETLMRGIARTRLVERAHAEALWTERKRLFFKPAAGYGSKAVYRGDKLTHRVWDEILAGEYVAQELVPPGERQVQVEAETTALKYDVRCFVYAGKIQLLAARLYQGQATNFRTPGGGFAPVFYPPAGETE